MPTNPPPSCMNCSRASCCFSSRMSPVVLAKMTASKVSNFFDEKLEASSVDVSDQFSASAMLCRSSMASWILAWRKPAVLVISKRDLEGSEWSVSFFGWAHPRSSAQVSAGHRKVRRELKRDCLSWGTLSPLRECGLPQTLQRSFAAEGGKVRILEGLARRGVGCADHCSTASVSGCTHSL